MAKLFEDVALSLYKERLRHMHGTNLSHVRACSMVHVTNHLLGGVACRRCGDGRFERKGLSVRIRMLMRDRIYLYLGDDDDAARLATALLRWPNLKTNLEFPLPILSYSKAEKLALCFDPVSSTAIDFFSDRQKTRVYKRLLDLSVEEYGKLGINYVALDSHGQELVNTTPPKVERPDTLKKLRSVLKELMLEEGEPF